MTPERIGRQDDERLYQPRIHSRWIRQLHRLSQETGEPMTILVDRAIREYLASYADEGGATDLEPSGHHDRGSG